MGTPQQLFVDPSIAADSGAGTVGDPYGDLQYCLDSETHDGTNGDEIHIKAGTDEILAATIDFSTFGTPAYTHPTMFRGYTSAAYDGGIGGIDGNAGNFSVVALGASATGVMFKDMHLHNTGSAIVLDLLGKWTGLEDCEIDDSTGGGVTIGDTGWCLGCNIHNCQGNGILAGPAAEVAWNYLANGANDFAIAIKSGGNYFNSIHHNIISIDGASHGIDLATYFSGCFNNSILSAGGTGSGIYVSAGSTRVGGKVYNNIVEGFSGVGGKAIALANDPFYTGKNSYFNCTAGITHGDYVWIDFGGDESLGSSPFAKSGADSFANRFVYFAPNDVGNVRTGGYPGGNMFRGAVRPAIATGGRRKHPYLMGV